MQLEARMLSHLPHNFSFQQPTESFMIKSNAQGTGTSVPCKIVVQQDCGWRSHANYVFMCNENMLQDGFEILKSASTDLLLALSQELQLSQASSGREYRDLTTRFCPAAFCHARTCLLCHEEENNAHKMRLMTPAGAGDGVAAWHHEKLLEKQTNPRNPIRIGQEVGCRTQPVQARKNTHELERLDSQNTLPIATESNRAIRLWQLVSATPVGSRKVQLSFPSSLVCSACHLHKHQDDSVGQLQGKYLNQLHAQSQLQGPGTYTEPNLKQEHVLLSFACSALAQDAVALLAAVCEQAAQLVRRTGKNMSGHVPTQSGDLESQLSTAIATEKYDHIDTLRSPDLAELHHHVPKCPASAEVAHQSAAKDASHDLSVRGGTMAPEVCSADPHIAIPPAKSALEAQSLATYRNPHTSVGIPSPPRPGACSLEIEDSQHAASGLGQIAWAASLELEASNSSSHFRPQQQDILRIVSDDRFPALLRGVCNLLLNSAIADGEQDRE
jgi:hypothetical protein